MSGFDWSCPCGLQVLQETCSECGQWQCSRCRGVVPAKSGCPECHVGKVHTATRGRTTKFKVFRAGVQAVRLETPDGESRSASWREGKPELAVDEPFCYAPGDAVKITWELLGEDFVKGALELRCECHPDEGPRWSHSLDADALSRGECDWDGSVEDRQGDTFPEGRITGEHSPYLVQLEAQRPAGKRVHPPRAYTRFETGPWLELLLEDEVTGAPVAGEAYEITTPDGEVVEGTLDDQGFARLDGLTPGTCQVRFPRVDGEAWRRKESYLEVELRDESGRPVAGERYCVTLPDGSKQEGELDPDGLARIDGIPEPGLCQVSFPALDGEAWSRQD